MKTIITTTTIIVLAAVLMVGCKGKDIIIGGGSPYNPVEVTNAVLNFRTDQVHVDGTRAYAIGPQPGMLVFEVGNPSNPVILANVLEDYFIRDFAISNGHVFLLDSESRFSIFDINSLGSGQAIAMLDDLGSASHICITGDRAYIGGYDELVLIDISDPSSPRIIGKVDDAYISYPFEVYQGIAYTGGYDRLTLVDVDPPETAHVIKTIEVPGLIYSVEASGDYLYLAGRSDGLSILDITEPESPGLLSNTRFDGYAYDVEVAGQYAYVAADRDGMLVVDVTSTVMPEVVGAIDTPWYAMDVELAGNSAFVSDNSSSLDIIDISNPETPVQAGLLDTPSRADELEVHGGYAYAIKDNSICIVDIDPVEDAITVGSLQIPGDNFYLSGISIEGNRAYVGEYGHDSETNMQYGEIRVIDITDPSSPAEVADHRMVTSPKDLVFANGYLHIVGLYNDPIDYHNNYYVYLMLDAATFEQVTSMELPCAPSRIHVRNGYAYLTTGYDLLILDIDPPEDVHLVKTLDIRAGNAVVPGDTTGYRDIFQQSGYEIWGERNGQSLPPYIQPSRIDMVFTDMYAYLCYGSTGTLEVIDINPPESAEIISMYDMPGHCTALSMGEDRDYIFASFSDIGLAIIDIASPEDCRLAEIFSSENETMDVAVEGEYAYIADGPAGLRIIDLR